MMLLIALFLPAALFQPLFGPQNKKRAFILCVTFWVFKLALKSLSLAQIPIEILIEFKL